MTALPLWDHRWLAKAMLQKGISRLGLLPVYHRAQRSIGRLKDFSPSSRIEYAGKLAADVGLHRLQGAIAVEIGTGWVPVVPAGLHLLGVRSVYSFDLSRHLQPDMVAPMVRQLVNCVPDLVRRSGASAGTIHERLRALGSDDPDDLLRQMGFSYHAPTDFSRSGLAAGSIDIVYSNLVLEHVTPGALGEILREARRVLKPGGLMWHNVDFTDHYSHTFTSLSPMNFLRYGQGFWDVASNDILYMNRLRRVDYARAFEDAGFECVKELQYQMTADEPMVKVHPDFARYPEDELRCKACRFVLRLAD